MKAIINRGFLQKQKPNKNHFRMHILQSETQWEYDYFLIGIHLKILLMKFIKVIFT